eukprot:11164098-Lingulodinium_polyedra.AAC.1
MAANLPYASPWLLAGRGGSGRGGRCIALEVNVEDVPRRTVAPTILAESNESRGVEFRLHAERSLQHE